MPKGEEMDEVVKDILLLMVGAAIVKVK